MKRVLTFSVLIIGTFANCGLFKMPSGAKNGSPSLQYNVIAVLPASHKLLFDNAIANNMLASCAPNLDRQIVDKNTEIKLTKLLQDGMMDRVRSTVVTSQQIDEKLSPEQKLSFYTDPAVFSSILEELKVEVVLASTSLLFEVRLGSAYAEDKTADIALSKIIIERKEKKVLWHRCMHETQNTLLADLTQIAQFFSTGGRWLTADELLRLGVMRAMRDFPRIEPRN
jgi:hypothetical protein